MSKITFPKIIDDSEVIEKVIEELKDIFNKTSITFFEETIIKNLQKKNIEDSLNYMDVLRKKLSDLDTSLQLYYNLLIQYQTNILNKVIENSKERDIVSE